MMELNEPRKWIDIYRQLYQEWGIPPHIVDAHYSVERIMLMLAPPDKTATTTRMTKEEFDEYWRRRKQQ